MIIELEQLCIDKEFDDLLPVLTLDEYENLEKNILKNGVLDPIKIWQDPESQKWIIIDGHNRYHIMKNNNIKFDIWHGFKIMYEEKLPTRESVKQWMLEQQLGRRNLSDIEKYDIVQKFKSLIEKEAKDNQSSGGKSLSNLSKVNTRKELSEKVGVSEGTYHKLDKIMKSDNEEVKQQLREKKVSIDKAYREVKNTIPKKKEEITPQKQIEKFDSRMNDIDMEISSLKIERESLMRRRTSLFESLDIECELQYQFTDDDTIGFSRTCNFYIEIDGHREVFVKCGVYVDETPASIWLRKIPEKYKNDFIMLWKRAHKEDVEDFYRRSAKWTSKETMTHNREVEDNKDFYKKCFRILAKSFHPDNADGDMEDMKSLNQLKRVLGI